MATDKQRDELDKLNTRLDQSLPEFPSTPPTPMNETEAILAQPVRNQMKEFDLSPSQLNAKEQITNWFDGVNSDNFDGDAIFRLFGFAGTGKTTTIRSLIGDLGLTNGKDVLFGAYTGKAAMVMRKTGLPASTIHSLIYKPVLPNKEECEKLAKILKDSDDPDEKKRFRKDLMDASKIRFQLREEGESALDKAQLLVLDECSMVNNDMLKDLLTFKVPMLVLGDPGQLPPIEGEGALTGVKPDIMLTEIHRQATGNPIIDYATRARNGIYIPFMANGSSSHVRQFQLNDDQVTKFDQVLTGKNATRKMLNQNIRRHKGFDSPYPQVGDKLICLKNDMNVPGGGLFNGMICEVMGVGDVLESAVEIEIRREIDPPNFPPIKVKALRAHFDAYHDKEALDNVKWWERADSNEFDYGYAITVHKAQGSQWENVLVYDDKFLVWKRDERKRWLYTGITRAVESITIAE